MNRWIVMAVTVTLAVPVVAQVSEFNRANPALYAQAQAQAKVHTQLQTDPPMDKPADPPKEPAAKPESAKPASAFTPTAEEDKDLKIAQLSAQLAQSAFSQKSQTLPEFTQFQQSLASLNAECTRIIVAHKWPTGTVCDVQQVPIRFCSALPCTSASVSQSAK